MRVTCEEREQLWASYNDALRAYMVSVAEFTRANDPDNATLRELLVIVRSHREALGEHCREHG